MSIKRKIILVELLLMTIWVYLLFSFAEISKTQVYFLDNPIYIGTVIYLTVLALAYPFAFVSTKIFLNIILAPVIFAMARAVSIFSINYLMDFLMAQDKVTPFGWTFKFRWMDLLATNIALILFFELVRKILPANWRTPA